MIRLTRWCVGALALALIYAHREAIDRPPVGARVVDLLQGSVVVDRRVVVLEAEQLEAGAAHRQVELAADGQHTVADRLGVRGAARGAIVGEVVGGDAGAGAAAGAAAARAQSRRQNATAAQQQQQAASQQTQQQQAAYGKARSACLEGRGYSVK